MADPTDPPDDGTDPSAAAPDDAAQPTVLCTVSLNSDGTFLLQAGDEDDDSDEDTDSGADSGTSEDDTGSGADDAGAGEGAEGMPPAAGGVAAAPKGQTFDSPGPLLKAILDLVKQAQEGSGGSADDQMMAGYSGASSSTPS
jgi:hypothetical protein